MGEERGRELLVKGVKIWKRREREREDSQVWIRTTFYIYFLLSKAKSSFFCCWKGSVTENVCIFSKLNAHFMLIYNKQTNTHTHIIGILSDVYFGPKIKFN